MKIKVSEAQGPALNWLVAKAEGKKPGYEYTLFDPIIFVGDDEYDPSTDWSQGGPIIERERICISIQHDGVWLAYSMQNYGDRQEFMHSGCVPLIAAMRCYVASKLGEEVEVPDELVKG